MDWIGIEIEYLKLQMDGWIKDRLIHILEHGDAEHSCLDIIGIHPL